MKIRSFVLGDFETNSYVLTADEDSKDCLIIDTGLDEGPLLAYLAESGLRPEAVIFTHGHIDHIKGANGLRENYPEIKVAIYADDAKAFSSPVKNLSMLAEVPVTFEPADIVIEAEGAVEFAGIRLEVFHTPGHTAGGICLYSREDGVVFVGDTLFAGSIGRTDFPGGSFEQLIDSIKSRLLVLPDETKVFTGHGPATTIGTEKRTNQYLVG